ncbi:tandem-type lipoprotein [Staphylococcus sp. Marseille-Q5304]|uniref:tandem-type lipoprotein n=1 Tax=Staphylococcus sp. Marseille-Q5304 TaxID=2942200 RepID=UPI002072CAB4|nr:tandem-type lipoprotein [Staphylococcus sp. Marseille-Q5304]
MNFFKRLLLYIFVLFASILISGCGILNIESSKERQVKKNFSNTLDTFPIKNLEDLYDKEGYRDDQFEKGDKGMWVIRSEMIIQPKGKNLKSRGMVIYMDRNTRMTSGYFVVNEIGNASKGRTHDYEKKYPVKMENNKFIPTKKIKNDSLKREIEDFKFFVQYANFKQSKDIYNGDVSYNPNVPSYSAEYDLKNSDYNVKQLRDRYKIPTKQAPKLRLKRMGKLKGSSLGYKNLEYIFVENQEQNVYFSSSMNFKPSENN